MSTKQPTKLKNLCMFIDIIMKQLIRNKTFPLLFCKILLKTGINMIVYISYLFAESNRSGKRRHIRTRASFLLALD